MICRTPAQAFEAGLIEPCDHGVTPSACPTCQLTDLEISRLVVLHREHAPQHRRPAQAA
ncbi:hypothetical protein ACFUJ0_06225 [Streptomyces sp. NPDC057242]|uniref:hypothetical protein n=1 Tax=unclassified Streptomyces TaxID=2593676 RepID=UPI003626C895